MAAYEIVMRFPDREEVRLTDTPLAVGSNVEIAGTEWLVQSEEAQQGRVLARFICVELRDESRELRARSSDLIGRSHELRERNNPERKS